MSNKKQSRDPHFQDHVVRVSQKTIGIVSHANETVWAMQYVCLNILVSKARLLDKQYRFIVWILSSHKPDFRSNSVDSLQDICLNILCRWKAFPHDILGSKPFLQTL